MTVFICWISLFWYSFSENAFLRNLLWTQLEIWLDQRSNIWLSKDWKVENSLVMQKDIINQKQVDLISLLDNAKTEQERLKIIDQYILSINNSISNARYLWDYENSQVTYYNNAAKECEAPIKAKNSEFTDAVKSYNYEKAELISKEIAELRACVAKNQVYAKAHASYASASKSTNTLQKRAEYLSKNREKIAKYYEILKPDLLKELYDISRTVEREF